MGSLGKLAIASLLGAVLASAQTPAQPTPNPLTTHRKPQYPGAAQPAPATTPQVPQPRTAPANTQPGKAEQPVVSTPVIQSAPQITQAPPEPKIPATAPRISFHNGELTVVAENA